MHYYMMSVYNDIQMQVIIKIFKFPQNLIHTRTVELEYLECCNQG